MKLKDFDFRIWDNKYKEYIFTNRTISKYYKDASTVTSLAGRIRKEKYSGNLVFDDLGCDCEECEIELWTGYFDKNGKKIYENDIIKNESLEEIYYITRDNTYKMFKIIIYDKDCNENLYRKKNPADINLLKMLVSYKNMSVIGNIHENAELLKC